jgi:hypothetical protein
MTWQNSQAAWLFIDVLDLRSPVLEFIKQVPILPLLCLKLSGGVLAYFRFLSWRSQVPSATRG